MRLSVLLAGLILLVACPSFAQSNVTLYMEGGPEISNEPKQFDNFYSTGVHVGGGVGYPITGDLEVLLRAQYDALPFDETGVKDFLREGGFIGPGDRSDTEVKGAGANLLSGTVSLKLNSTIGRRLGVSLIGGVGLYRHETYGVDVDFPSGSIVQAFEFIEQEGTSVGLNVGFGFSLPVTEDVNARVEPQLILVFSGEGEETAPLLERTGDLSYVPIQFGVSWNI